MMTLSNPLAEAIDLTPTERDPQEIRALARMIVFARQNAIDLKLEKAVHCLDLALRCVLQENERDVDGLDFRDMDLHKKLTH